jgi:hypothetical protein
MGEWIMTTAVKHRYKPTESKYKGGAEEMHITYDLLQATRGGSQALYPKVKRVYIAGKVKGWHVGAFVKRSGKKVHGVKIDYEQRRKGYTRQGYTATRGQTRYQVPPTHVMGSTASFSKIVEVPEEAHHVQFHTDKLPEKYQDALQDVR